jgi:hypothetical protein
MLKVRRLVSGVTIRANINDGESSMLTKELKIEGKVSTRNSVSTSTDHSISDQDFHSKELLSAMVLTTFG